MSSNPARPGETDARDLMDRIYRGQRHIYDLTRKYYLFGRDTLIAGLPVKPGETVIEVGCGTARNLVALAQRHPEARFAGLDASAEMLKTAEQNLARAGLSGKVRLVRALSTELDSAALGAPGGFDRIIFPYSLSMISAWRESIDHALTQLAPGGSIHVVDFGDQEGLPNWFKTLLGAWLARFHVRFRPEVAAHFASLAAAGKGQMRRRSLMRGYAYLLDFETAANP